MSAPFVSIVLPTYNRAGVISQTIDNLFEQTYSDFELIVVDDGSTDDTKATLKQYGQRIRVISQENAGPAVARNRGLEAARGQMIAFQDSDDLWLPSKLERQVALLSEYGRSTPCCLCNARMESPGGKEWTSFEESSILVSHKQGLWSNVLEVLATRFILFNQTATTWRSALEKVGGFPEDIKYLEDYDLPLRLALEGPWALIRDPLVIYRQNSAGSFSGVAQKDPVALKQCAVKIFERISARVDEGNASNSSRRLLRHRLNLLRQALFAAKCTQADSPVERTIGRTVNGLHRYYNAAFRRSPWFPQPITSSADDIHPDRKVHGRRS